MNEYPYQQPSPDVLELAKQIATLERQRLSLRITEVLKRDFEPMHGFTFICNACGSLSVSIPEVYRDGEFMGIEFHCTDCDNRG